MNTRDALELKGCPFCGEQLFRSSRPVNPKAYCRTEGCFGSKMPVVNLDDPVFVAAWNTRATPATDKTVEGIARDWKTVEGQINTAQGNDLLALMRDYLVMTSRPGNDLAPLYIARIDAILSAYPLRDEAAIRADEREKCAKVAENFDHPTTWPGCDSTHELSNLASVVGGETCDAIAEKIREGAK